MPKTIAYLINMYPMASLTFIRREIAALESLGVQVRRYAVRAWDTPLVDPDDLAEAGRTRRILDVGKVRLLGALLGTALRRPGRFFRALAQAWRLGKGSSRGRLVQLAYLAEACVLRGWTARDGITHLHVHFGTNSASVALLCRLLGGPPYSFTVHGPEEYDQPIALALGTKIHHAAFVVAVCSFGRSQLWRWAEFRDWDKVKVVRCGVDPAFLNVPPSPPSSQPRLISIGRLVEQKGQMLLVDAAARLRDQGRVFEIVLIGGGTLRPALEKRIRDLQLGGHIILAGWMTGEQVRQEILASRALVLPSFAEGLPVVIMEALALRRPVVATYVAGIPELVRPGETGWLVPAGDAEELAEAIAQVLDAPADQLERMGQAGAERVVRNHDIRTEAGKLLKLIEA
jgi:glycosyltransferase involved in cell wall biosynthesis